MKKKLSMFLLVLAAVSLLAACGKKEEPQAEPEEVVLEQNTPENKTHGPEFGFLELIGKDCQMLPGDVTVDVEDIYAVAVGGEKEVIGGVEGTVTYTYKMENPYITEISWTATDCEENQIKAISDALSRRYGEANAQTETQMPEGSGKTHIYQWADADGCSVRASLDENPVNGGNATILWSRMRDEDLGFLDNLGAATASLPKEQMIDMSEGSEGMLLDMNPITFCGLAGSVTYYFTEGADASVTKITWVSDPVGKGQIEGFVNEMINRYGPEQESGVDAMGFEFRKWSADYGQPLTMSIQDMGGMVCVQVDWY